MNEVDRPTSHVPRRTIAKGAAWTVPVLAVGVPVSAHAASGAPQAVAVGVACKLPGSTVCPELYAGLPGLDPDRSFGFPLLVTNNTPKNVVVKASITITSSGLPFSVVGILPTYCTPIASGASVKVIVYANSDNPANNPVTLSFTVPWGHDCSDVDHPPIVVSGVVVDAFSPCSSRVPFPTGVPTCDPPFYQVV